jgi:hypothetical protein
MYAIRYGVCVGYFTMLFVARLYRVSQEERSIFWEVTVSVILSKISV